MGEWYAKRCLKKFFEGEEREKKERSEGVCVCVCVWTSELEEGMARW